MYQQLQHIHTKNKIINQYYKKYYNIIILGLFLRSIHTVRMNLDKSLGRFRYGISINMDINIMSM